MSVNQEVKRQGEKTNLARGQQIPPKIPTPMPDIDDDEEEETEERWRA